MTRLIFIILFFGFSELWSQNFKIGQQIQVLYDKDGKWYDAKILNIERNNYFITYTGYDSSWDTWVSEDHIREKGTTQNANPTSSKISTNSATVYNTPAGEFQKGEFVEVYDKNDYWEICEVTGLNSITKNIIATSIVTGGSYNLSTDEMKKWCKKLNALPWRQIAGKPDETTLKQMYNDLSQYNSSLLSFQNTYFHKFDGNNLSFGAPEGGKYPQLKKQISDLEQAYKIIKANFNSVGNDKCYKWETNPQLIVYWFENKKTVIQEMVRFQYRNNTLNREVNNFINAEFGTQEIEKFKYYLALKSNGFDELKKYLQSLMGKFETDNIRDLENMFGFAIASTDFEKAKPHYNELHAMFDEKGTNTFTKLYFLGNNGESYDVMAHNTELEQQGRKAILATYPGASIEKIGVEKNDWTIIKNEYGIPKYAYQHGAALIKPIETTCKMIVAFTVRREYAGGGGYKSPTSTCTFPDAIVDFVK